MAKKMVKQNMSVCSSAKERDKQEFRYVQETLYVDRGRKEDQNKQARFLTSPCFSQRHML